MYNILANTLFVGKKIIYLPSCQSTNTTAAQLAQNHQLEEGSIVITDFQTGGRGQFGSQWEGQSGQNLLMSVVLRPTFLAAVDIFILNMAVSLAVFNTVQQLAPGQKTAIKWPNDVLINQQKTAGILIENNLQSGIIYQSIVGIGLNINQTQFDSPQATSLSSQTKQTHSLAAVLELLSGHLEANYICLRSGNKDKIGSQYMQNLYLIGQKSWFALPNTNLPFQAILTGICPQGRLILQSSDDKLLYFSPKEIIFVK